MKVPTTPEGLTVGDRFLFNDRSIPCTVEVSTPVDADDGSIHLTHCVIADGPNGGRIWLDRTSTGRIRVKHSPPWCAAANVHRLVRVGETEPNRTSPIDEIHSRVFG